MGVANVVANAAAIFTRIFSSVITVGTVASVIAAGVTMTVVITVVIKVSPGSKDPFHHSTVVIVQSIAQLVFNRDIKSYELEYYYNATETLITLVEALNNHLKQVFPNYFIKVVISEFAREPTLNFTGRRKRQDGQLTDIYSKPQSTLTSMWLSSGIDSSSTISNRESSKSFPPSKPKSSQLSVSTTTDFMGITGEIEPTESPSTTASELLTYTSDIEETSVTTSQTSTRTFSTLSSLFSSVTSTISKPFSTTTAQTNIAGNCTISTFNETKRPSLIYLNGTLYFNVTNEGDITVTKIIIALNSFFPSIKLIDICREPSSDNGSFNATLSRVQPPSKANIDLADLDALDSIPSALIDVMNSVTTPLIILNELTTAATSPTITSTSTEATTVNVG